MTAALRRSPRALTAVLLVCAAGCAIQPPNSDDGSASVEQGVPEWWGDRDIQVCPNE